MITDRTEQQTPHWSTHSRHKCILVKVEVKEDKTIEKEEEAHTEVKEAALQAEVEGAATRI